MIVGIVSVKTDGPRPLALLGGRHRQSPQPNLRPQAARRDQPERMPRPFHTLRRLAFKSARPGRFG
jgi:hypothetical protein